MQRDSISVPHHRKSPSMEPNGVDKSAPKAVWVVPALMSFIAIGPWPYGFYMLLRIVIFGAAAFLCWREVVKRPGNPWIWMFGLIAILFNPFLPVHLSRPLWLPINLLVAALFLTHLRMISSGKP